MKCGKFSVGPTKYIYVCIFFIICKMNLKSQILINESDSSLKLGF